MPTPPVVPGLTRDPTAFCAQQADSVELEERSGVPGQARDDAIGMVRAHRPVRALYPPTSPERAMAPHAPLVHYPAMPSDFAWIRPEPGGLYIRPADVWIDPSRPVGTALVTHGHADHARAGHGVSIATPATLAIMRERYGEIGEAWPMPYNERATLPGGVHATLIPAGHVLGSAQVLLEHAGERVIVTGDYKRPRRSNLRAVPGHPLATS